MVNVINPKFFQLLEKWKPAGIMGLVSQEVRGGGEEGENVETKTSTHPAPAHS
jgi:hypothetical protein